MNRSTILPGYSLLAVILIVAVIAIVGIIGAQGIFNKTIKDAKEKEIYITRTAEIAEDHDNAPLAKAVREENAILVALALNGGASPNAITSSGNTVLHRAAGRSLLDIARLLIDHGADVNSKNPESITPLHLAAGNGHVEMVKLLIDCDADVSCKNDDGQTPLAMALQGLGATEPAEESRRRRYQETIDLLRQRGAR